MTQGSGEQDLRLKQRTNVSPISKVRWQNIMLVKDLSIKDYRMIRTLASQTIFRMRRRLCSLHINFNELQEELATFLLTKAILHYDPKKAQLKTFITFCSKRRLNQIARDRIGRHRTLARKGVRTSLARFDHPHLEEAEYIRSLMLKIRKPRYRLALTKWCQGKTLETIGKEMGFTRSRAQQIIVKCITQLREECGSTS